MDEKAQKAFELFKNGYNCSQAVFVAFADDLGIKPDTAAQIASSFGGGMGGMREVCGAVSGMFMAAGIRYGYTDPTDLAAKREHYKRIQKMALAFSEQNGSIICHELLGIRPEGDNLIPRERTAAYYKKRPCAEYVRCAAQIFAEMTENDERANHVL